MIVFTDARRSAAAARRHTKDCYLVVPAAPVAGLIVIGNRPVMIPANTARVYSLHAGPEYGCLVDEQVVA